MIAKLIIMKTSNYPSIKRKLEIHQINYICIKNTFYTISRNFYFNSTPYTSRDIFDLNSIPLAAIFYIFVEFSFHFDNFNKETTNPLRTNTYLSDVFFRTLLSFLFVKIFNVLPPMQLASFFYKWSISPVELSNLSNQLVIH